MSAEADAGGRRARVAEWDAGVYDRLSAPQIAWGERVLARLALRGDETVLDAGCGGGRLTERLFERLPRGRVVALDRSPAMLEVARARLTPRFGERVRVVEADLQRHVESPPVDVVFSTATFHWVLDHPRLFANLFASLVPGGALVAQCGGGRNCARARARFRELAARPEWRDHFEGFVEPWEFSDPETTAARLRAAGFEDVRTGLEPAMTTFADPLDYRLFVQHVLFGDHLARIADPAARERFVDVLTAPADRDDPPYSLDYWRLNLDARRPA